jgi:hypothetical protein
MTQLAGRLAISVACFFESRYQDGKRELALTLLTPASSLMRKSWRRT